MPRSFADQHTPSGPLTTGPTNAPKADNQMPIQQSPPQKQGGKARRWPWIVALLVVLLVGYVFGHKFGNSTNNAPLAAGTATPILGVSTTIPIQTSGSTIVSTQVVGGIAPTQVAGSTTSTQTGGSTIVQTGSTTVPTQVAGSTTSTQTGGSTTVPTQVVGGTIAPTQVAGSTIVPTQSPTTSQISYIFNSATGGDTEVIKVLPNWILQWTCNPVSQSSLGQYNLLVNVMSGSDATPIDPLAVNTVCKVGNTVGQIYEKRGGIIYLDIDTEGAWTVTVQQQAT